MCKIFCVIGHDGPYKQCATQLLTHIKPCEPPKGKAPLRYHHTTCFPKKLTEIWGQPPKGSKLYCKVCERKLLITGEDGEDVGKGWILERGRHGRDWSCKRA